MTSPKKGPTLPFGKHKGQTVLEVADEDLLYLDWLLGQDWFRERFPAQYQATLEICEERNREIDSQLEEP